MHTVYLTVISPMLPAHRLPDPTQPDATMHTVYTTVPTLACARRWLHGEDLAIGEALQKRHPIVGSETEELPHRPRARGDENIFRAVRDAEVATATPLSAQRKGVR